MKITTLPIIVMFVASALILPAGMSYATYAPGFTAGTPTVQSMDNQTNANQTMTMSSNVNQTNANQTSTTPAMNQTMTIPPSTNQTSTPPAMNQTTMTNSTTVSPPVTTKPKMLLPLEQVKAGVAPKDVQCGTGFTLILKAEDGSPACVDPTVAQILAQRGW